MIDKNFFGAHSPICVELQDFLSEILLQMQFNGLEEVQINFKSSAAIKINDKSEDTRLVQHAACIKSSQIRSIRISEAIKRCEVRHDGT